MFFLCYNLAMQRDLLLYQRALFLRKKKGYSYGEIRDEIPIAKSTLSVWLNQIELTLEQRERIKSRVREAQIKYRFDLPNFNRQKRQKEITIIRVEAKNKIGRLTDREFLISGAMLYWGEGTKTGSCLQVCNADPLFMKFMMGWFRKCLFLTEDRFTAAIHYHEGQNEQTIKAFWSKLLGIPLSSFNKSFKKPPGTGHRTHYLQWGVCRVRIRRSADLFHQVAGWKDGLITDKISGKPS